MIAEKEYSRIVWMKKGEEFPGTIFGGQKQGFYELWLGVTADQIEVTEFI